MQEQEFLEFGHFNSEALNHDFVFEPVFLTDISELLSTFSSLFHYIGIIQELIFMFQQSWLQLHYSILLFTIIIICLLTILQVLSYVLSVETDSTEKTSSYECGFEPFGHTHLPINIQYYLIGILYLIFDLELVFFYPWISAAYSSGLATSFWPFFYFLIIILAGFIYEWRQGGLNWSTI